MKMLELILPGKISACLMAKHVFSKVHVTMALASLEYVKDKSCTTDLHINSFYFSLKNDIKIKKALHLPSNMIVFALKR